MNGCVEYQQPSMGLKVQAGSTIPHPQGDHGATHYMMHLDYFMATRAAYPSTVYSTHVWEVSSNAASLLYKEAKAEWHWWALKFFSPNHHLASTQAWGKRRSTWVWGKTKNMATIARAIRRLIYHALRMIYMVDGEYAGLDVIKYSNCLMKWVAP